MCPQLCFEGIPSSKQLLKTPWVDFSHTCHQVCWCPSFNTTLLWSWGASILNGYKHLAGLSAAKRLKAQHSTVLSPPAPSFLVLERAALFLHYSALLGLLFGSRQGNGFSSAFGCCSFAWHHRWFLYFSLELNWRESATYRTCKTRVKVVYIFLLTGHRSLFISSGLEIKEKAWINVQTQSNIHQFKEAGATKLPRMYRLSSLQIWGTT